MYDPIKLGEIVEGQVVRGDERRYVRFRADRWYGGIATGDVVGCNLRCGMCWAWRKSAFVVDVGDFYSPERAYEILAEIAGKRGFRQLRLSGGEPTLGRRHLLKLLELVDKSEFVMVLETNGVLIGSDPSYAKDLLSYSNLVVRVSIKGCTPDEFKAITLAPEWAFELQLKALENLVSCGAKPCVDVYPAVMLGFSTPETMSKLAMRLKEVDPKLVECIDVEYVIAYPHVIKLMRSRGLRPTNYVLPGKVPKFML